MGIDAAPGGAYDDEHYEIDPAHRAHMRRTIGWTREQFLNSDTPPVPEYPALVIEDLTEEEWRAFEAAINRE
jgi:hypothetical protein